MATSITVYRDSQMSRQLSTDGSYRTPLSFGSIGEPMDGRSEDSRPSIPLWIKNTGTEKLFGITALAHDGTSSAQGGIPSSTDDAFIELALDRSVSPASPALPPRTAFSIAQNSSSSAKIVISNIFNKDGIKKEITSYGHDDDCRTMLPGEFAVIWVGCSFDSARSPGGVLPVPVGIKNILLKLNAVSGTFSSAGRTGFSASVCVTIYAVHNVGAKVYIEDMVSNWKMDTGTGNVAFDEKERHNGVISGATWWNIGVGGKSLDFTPGGVINMGNEGSFNPGSHSFAIEVWFKSPDRGPGGVLFSKKGFGGGFEMKLLPDGTLSVMLSDPLNTIVSTCGTLLNDSGWHHAVFIVDRTLSKFRIRCDKEDIADIDISSLTGTISNPSDFTICGSFTGRVDEMTFYNMILSNDELDARFDTLWEAYLAVYGITEDGEYVRDEQGRIVTDEVF